MTSLISSLNSSDAASTTYNADAQVNADTTTKVTDQEGTGEAGTVELSEAAQARLLKRSGETVSQIANNLGVSVETVKDYLDLTEDTLENLLKASG